MAYRNDNNRNSGNVVTKATLLARARATGGFRGVKTTCLQMPNKDNDMTVIFHATVTMLDQSGVMEFDGTADAGPHNMKENMTKWTVQTGETRAVVRALKWALGESRVAAEELDDYDPSQPAETPSIPFRAKPDQNGPIVPDQVNAIRNICRGKNLDAEQMARKKASVSLENLSYSQAKELIADLNKRPAAARA